MEALPEFAAVAEAEAALSAALGIGGFRNAAFAVVSAAREVRAAWCALLLASPCALADAAGGLARCAAACEGRAKAAAAEAGPLPLEARSSAAQALRALLQDADVAYAALDAALAPRCAALAGGAGGAAAGEGEAAAAARLRADARMRRGDARRYAAETLEEAGSEACLAALDAASALYRQALALWPACGRARNLLGVAALARGDEAAAACLFLCAQQSGTPFPAAAANAAPLLAAAAARPLLDADAAGEALAGLAETRLLRCVGLVVASASAPRGGASFDARGFEAAARAAGASLEAAMEAGALPPPAALRCVVAVAAAARSASPRAWRGQLRLPPPGCGVAAWPDALLAALRMAGDLAPPLLRAAASPDGRYLAAACALLNWLRFHTPLLAAPAFRLAATRAALAQLLNAAPLRAAAAVGESLGPCALAAALPEDWHLRGVVPFAPAMACRVFCGADDAAARAVPGTRARAVRAARLALLGCWAASEAAAADGAVVLVGYDATAAAYTDCDGAPPPPLAPPPPPPPRRFPAPPPAPLPPPAPALRHSLSFAALSLGAPLPRVPSFNGESDLWAPPEQPTPQPAPPPPPPAPRRSRGPPPDAPGGDPLHAAAGGLGPQLVVLDVPNIAMRAGRGARCSVAGVTAAADFWRRRGHVVVGFLPAPMLDAPDDADVAFPQPQMRRPPGVPISTLLPPDDPAALRAMAADGLLVATPAGDYDDSYALAYARRHGGVLVSNDRYADAVATAPPGRRRDALRAWLRARVCTFAFAGGEFLPNPAFSFWTQPEEDDARIADAPGEAEAGPPAEDTS